MKSGKIQMITYISFLRGVNMTGHNSIKMTELSTLYKDLGFNDVETYIQSGNVIFSNQDYLSKIDISFKIEKALLERFNYKVPVMIRTVDDMNELMSVNPFLMEKNFEPAKMAVIFLNIKTMDTHIQKVKDVDYPPDKFKILGSEIFTYCPNGFGKTKLYTTFFEKKLGVLGTARNWKTVTTLLNIALKR